MPSKDWYQHLGGGYRIFLERKAEAGVIKSFSVALIYENQCISRYDTAHGRPHKDILGESQGWMFAVAVADLTYNDIFHHAIRDYEENHENYLQFFRSH